MDGDKAVAPARQKLRIVLSGVRVLDFTLIGAGPTCTMYLGDLGADVIKIDPPGGKIGRKLGPPWYKDRSSIDVAFNRGKRSICPDLKSQDGREIAFELAQRADILVESFRPGVMDRLGLGCETLSRVNSGIVYCSVSGYGSHDGVWVTGRSGGAA